MYLLVLSEFQTCWPKLMPVPARILGVMIWFVSYKSMLALIMIMIMFPFQEFKEAIWSWSLSALEPKPD